MLSGAEEMGDVTNCLSYGVRFGDKSCVTSLWEKVAVLPIFGVITT
jgi:hypothetical protein